MEQNKDQSSAITLERAGFKLASHVATPGGPIMVNVTDVYEKDDVQLIHSYAMGGESWSIGAAVRGEAVAESPCNLFIDEHGDWKVSEFDYQGSPVYFHPAPASARAADAPSEPSEPLLTMAQVNAIRDTIKPGDGWDGDNWDFALANAVAATVKSRAADAPSEPSELAQELRTGADAAQHRFPGYAAVMRRAAAALDSQPTDQETRDRIRNAIVTCGHAIEDKSVKLFRDPKFPGGALSQLIDRILLAISGFSSQPTDGGVRNG